MPVVKGEAGRAAPRYRGGVGRRVVTTARAVGEEEAHACRIQGLHVPRDAWRRRRPRAMDEEVARGGEEATTPAATRQIQPTRMWAASVVQGRRGWGGRRRRTRQMSDAWPPNPSSSLALAPAPVRRRWPRHMGEEQEVAIPQGELGGCCGESRSFRTRTIREDKSS
jgi:hypothetical protein